jgi:hypothetical protein
MVSQRDESELRLPSGGTEMFKKGELCISFNQAERRHISITIGEQVIGVTLYDASERGDTHKMAQARPSPRVYL